jgi:hypothetical protein
MSRSFILLAALMLCTGCKDQESESTDADLTADDLGSGTGLAGSSILAPGDALGPPPGGGGAANNPQGNAPVQPQQTVIQPLRPADLVDKRAAMAANPNLVEVTNDVNAGDYFTAVTGSIYSAVSRYTIDAINHDIELQKNLSENNEYPSFEEYKSILERHNVQLKGLHANQVYAYDQSTGKICILEDQSGN